MLTVKRQWAVMFDNRERNAMTAQQVPELGRRVHYILTRIDAEEVNRRREIAERQLRDRPENATGVIVHVGNPVVRGDRFPMDIVRVWCKNPATATPDTPVNGKVLLDGNDELWVQSVRAGYEPGMFVWPSTIQDVG